MGVLTQVYKISLRKVNQSMFYFMSVHIDVILEKKVKCFILILSVNFLFLCFVVIGFVVGGFLFCCLFVFSLSQGQGCGTE